MTPLDRRLHVLEHALSELKRALAQEDLYFQADFVEAQAEALVREAGRVATLATRTAAMRHARLTSEA